MNLGPIFSNGWITKLVTLLNPFYIKAIETYTAKANVQDKNTISSVASITGAGDTSPTLTILKRCKCNINMNAHFNGSTNGITVNVNVDAQNISQGAFGANPNAGISGGGTTYNSILEVGEVVTFNWSATTAASRFLSILLEEI